MALTSKPHRKFTCNHLIVAAIEGNKEALLSSLDAGVAVDEMGSFTMTALMHAAKNGNLDCLRLLIGRGADVQKRSDNGMTAAHYAAFQGRTEVLLELFGAGVAVDVTDEYNLRTPFMCACLQGRRECALSLLRHGADVHKAASDGMTAAHYTALAGNTEMLVTVLDGGAAVDATDSNLITPLMCAASSGNLECLHLLIQHGADLRRQSSDGWTAAHYAAQRGNVEMLRLLIASGADVLQLAGRNSVAHTACNASQTDAASFALACGCRFALTFNEIEYGFLFFRSTLVFRCVFGLSTVNYAL